MITGKSVFTTLLVSITYLCACGPSTVCAVKGSPTDSRERAEARCNGALELLFARKQQEAIACATAALQDAKTFPLPTHGPDEEAQQKFIDTLEFVQWMAKHWNLGGPYRVELPTNWEQELKTRFEKVSRLADRVEGIKAESELERVVDLIKLALNALNHFDPDDKLQMYTDLLNRGLELVTPWEGKPATEYHAQMYILFFATVNAWPRVRRGSKAYMDEVRPWCERLKAVKNWYDDLQKDGDRAKVECAKWFGGGM